MLAGAVVLLMGISAAVALSTMEFGAGRWNGALTVWAIVGVGTGLILTLVGRVLRRSSHAADLPAIFAAQFSLSHACWLLAYPIAGWLATEAGFTPTWIVLGVLALAGVAIAVWSWPRRDPYFLEHIHQRVADPEHITDAVEVDDGVWRHSHEFVIDRDHHRWPASAR